MKFIWNEDHSETSVGFGDLHISSDDTKGYRPFQLMVSSIAGCSAGVFHKILEKQRLEYDHLSIDADVVRNEEQVNRIEKITLHFTIEGKDLNEKKLQRNLDISKKNCSMVQSVIDSIEVEEKLTVIQK